MDECVLLFTTSIYLSPTLAVQISYATFFGLLSWYYFNLSCLSMCAEQCSVASKTCLSYEHFNIAFPMNFKSNLVF